MRNVFEPVTRDHDTAGASQLMTYSNEYVLVIACNSDGTVGAENAMNGLYPRHVYTRVIAYDLKNSAADRVEPYPRHVYTRAIAHDQCRG